MLADTLCVDHVTVLLRASHLFEDNLKLLSLSAALLPPLPGLPSNQRDVVTLQEQH